MIRLLLAVSVVALAGCEADPEQRPLPKDEDIARLETALAKHACLGTLEEWERNYRLGFRRGFLRPDAVKPHFDIIEFHFRHTGPMPIRAARNVVPLGTDQDWPDSPTIQTLSGSYNVRSGRLSLDRCTPRNAAG